MNEILNGISEALQEGKAKVVRELAERALACGISAKTVLEEGLLAGMEIISEKFKADEVFVPEVLISARALNIGMAFLKPFLIESGVKPVGKAVIGTVKGDLHDIGKNLVRIMFEGKGIEVVDLGVDVSAEKFFDAYCAEKPDIVAISALLTTTKNEMKNVVDYFKNKEARKQVIIMVGGAPVTEGYCREIGADLYASDAASAAESAWQTVAKKRGASE